MVQPKKPPYTLQWGSVTLSLSQDRSLSLQVTSVIGIIPAFQNYFQAPQNPCPSGLKEEKLVLYKKACNH